ncbi:MAG: hypothetical protein ACRD1S_02605, partial [Vicinamibacterales bacterium]
MTEFGPVLPELMEGARNAIEVCLAVRPGERVALVADAASREVNETIAPLLDALADEPDDTLLSSMLHT